MTTPRIYVGTYAKYNNNGSIQGEWLDLDDYNDKSDFIQACLELHDDEEDPELMFQDWENIPDLFISECSIDPDFWDYMNCDRDEDAKAAYLACFGEWDESDFEERYRGQYDSFTELAEQLLDETGELEAIPENLRYYFDYEAYGRDLQLGGEFCEHDGHCFWNR